MEIIYTVIRITWLMLKVAMVAFLLTMHSFAQTPALPWVTTVEGLSSNTPQLPPVPLRWSVSVHHSSDTSNKTLPLDRIINQHTGTKTNNSILALNHNQKVMSAMRWISSFGISVQKYNGFLSRKEQLDFQSQWMVVSGLQQQMTDNTTGQIFYGLLGHSRKHMSHALGFQINFSFPIE